MNYKFYSSNIIGCKNFLPPIHLQDIRIELLNNRNNFQSSSWENKDLKTSDVQFFSEHCGGFDYWIKWGKTLANNEKIMQLYKWFYQQGLQNFLESTNKKNVFNLLKRSKTHNIHVVSYNNGGYYNWHNDSEIFTFNLILNEGNNLSGGDMLFMDDGKIITIPNQDNFMVVFPGYIEHAITPVKSKDGKDVAFPQQRFSIQYWVKV